MARRQQVLASPFKPPEWRIDGVATLKVAVADLPLVQHRLAHDPGASMRMLHTACRSGDLAAVHGLMRQSMGTADLRGTDENGHTALHLACRLGHAGIVQLLLDCGADTEAADLNGRTPLLTATSEGMQRAVEALLRAGAKPDVADKNGRTPLHEAVVQQGDLRLLDTLLPALLRLGAGRGVAELKFGYTPLHFATRTGRREAALKLLAAGADSDARDAAGHTPLHHAAAYGNPLVVSELLYWGATIDVTNNDGATPLYIAAKHGQVEVVRALLARAARADISDLKSQLTPLGIAQRLGHREVVQLLLEAEAKAVAVTHPAQPSPGPAPQLQQGPQLQPPTTTQAAALSSGFGTLAIEPSRLTRGRLLGRGSFGHVYAGMLGPTPVALKEVLPPEEDEGDEGAGWWLGHQEDVEEEAGSGAEGTAQPRSMPRDAYEDFVREIKLMAELRHPNVVLLMGVVAAPGRPLAMVMELVTRGSLSRVLHRVPQAEKPNDSQRMYMATQIARGMEYLHSKRVVHRDLSANNILVGRNWTIKLVDFGLSKVKDAAYVTTFRHGTPEYMAPEVLQGGPCDEKCDVFSFGMVLYELITGRQPWEGFGHPFAVMHACCMGGRPELPKRLDPPGIAELISQCWSQSPSERPSFAQISARVEAMAAAALRAVGGAGPGARAGAGAHASASVASEAAGGTGVGAAPVPAPAPAASDESSYGSAWQD